MLALPSCEPLRLLLLLFFAWAGMGTAHAHKASDAYLHLAQRDHQVLLRWDVALRDLDALVPLDANDDQQITWGEVKARQLEVEAHLLGQWRMKPASGGQDCVFAPARGPDGGRALPTLERRHDGVYYVITLASACHSPQGLFEVRYQLMRQVDPTHRGLLNIMGSKTGAMSLDPATPSHVVKLPPAPLLQPEAAAHPVAYQAPAQGLVLQPQGAALPVAERSAGDVWLQWWRDGVHHILIGADHVFFLMCLLLPAVLRRRSGADQGMPCLPVAHWQEAAKSVFMTVTMFTLAHSVTLALAATGLISISPKLIEPAIALTVALAAIDNIYPLFKGRQYQVTFLFGLVHGFGFAGVLAELNLPLAGFASALVAFNLGVESGQLMLVIPALLVLLALRHHAWYARMALPAVSLVCVLVALGWFTERVFDLAFMPI